MPSCWRNAAGKTICPLLEIMVFMISKISSYLACVKPDSMAQKPSRAKGGLLRPAGTNRCQERMALGNPLSCLQQAFARLLARFHKKFLTFRSSFVGAWFDAAGAVAYSVVCNRPEHRCYQALPVRWQRPSQRLLECRHRLKSPLEADQSRLFVMRLGRLGCHASYQVIR